MSGEKNKFLEPLQGRLSGEIDVSVARGVGTALLAAATAAPGPRFEIDCTGLTFIDSSGVVMLVDVAKRSGKHFRLINLHRAPRRVFEILDRCDMFGIANDRADQSIVTTTG